MMQVIGAMLGVHHHSNERHCTHGVSHPLLHHTRLSPLPDLVGVAVVADKTDRHVGVACDT